MSARGVLTTCWVLALTSSLLLPSGPGFARIKIFFWTALMVLAVVWAIFSIRTWLDQRRQSRAKQRLFAAQAIAMHRARSEADRTP